MRQSRPLRPARTARKRILRGTSFTALIRTAISDRSLRTLRDGSPNLTRLYSSAIQHFSRSPCPPRFREIMNIAAPRAAKRRAAFASDLL